MEHLPGVAPFVHGLVDVDAFVALEPHELPAEDAGKDFRHLGLAHPGLAFEKKRPVERQGKKDRRGEAAVGEIRLGAKSGLYGIDRVELQARPAAVARARRASTDARCWRNSPEA